MLSLNKNLNDNKMFTHDHISDDKREKADVREEEAENLANDLHSISPFK